MKTIILLLILVSCNGGGSDSKSSSPSSPVPVVELPDPVDPNIPVILVPENILLNYNESPVYTQSFTSTVTVQSDKNFSLAKLYRGDVCNQDAFIRNASRAELAAGISLGLNANQNNDIYIEVYGENTLKSIECLNVANVVHDTISPETLGMSDYLIAANKTVSQLEFLAGGDISQDHPESSLLSKIVYYKFVSSIRVKVGEFSLEEYNQKQIRLVLSENQANIFYFSVIDLAGNESDMAGVLIVDHQNTNPSAPLLTQELINLQNTYTDQNSIVLKGIVGVSSQRVRIYADSNRSQLLSDQLASVFEGSGISVNLTSNGYNDFFIVTVKNSVESAAVSFAINQKTTPPNPPVLSAYIMQLHNQTDDEDSHKYIAFQGTLDPDVSKVNIYSDSARANLLISYNRNDWLAGTGPVFLFSEGLNTLYFVSIDDVGRQSTQALFFQVVFDTAD